MSNNSPTVYIEKNDIHSTVTTWLYCHFHMAYAAERLGYMPYINWPENSSLQALHDKEKFAQLPNMFEWYFEQPYVKVAPSRNKVWTWESKDWGDNIETAKYQLISEPLSVIKDYYKKHLIFNQATNERGMALVDKYKIDFSKTIGITWRGTDVYLDGRPRMPIETYYPWIDDILEKGDFRIMCTAEEQGILDPLRARYPQAFVIEEFVSSPCQGKHNPEKIGDKRSGYERGLQPALMVWLFSKCAHYIKNRSSTGAVASWISSGKIYSLGHPENLGFPANTDTVEVEGKLYPLNR